MTERVNWDDPAFVAEQCRRVASSLTGAMKRIQAGECDPRLLPAAKALAQACPPYCNPLTRLLNELDDRDERRKNFETLDMLRKQTVEIERSLGIRRRGRPRKVEVAIAASPNVIPIERAARAS